MHHWLFLWHLFIPKFNSKTSLFKPSYNSVSNNVNIWLKKWKFDKLNYQLLKTKYHKSDPTINFNKTCPFQVLKMYFYSCLYFFSQWIAKRGNALIQRNESQVWAYFYARFRRSFLHSTKSWFGWSSLFISRFELCWHVQSQGNTRVQVPVVTSHSVISKTRHSVLQLIPQRIKNGIKLLCCVLECCFHFLIKSSGHGIYKYQTIKLKTT